MMLELAADRRRIHQLRNLPVDPVVNEIFGERQRKDLLQNRTAAHLGRNVLRKHPRRRSREAQLDSMRINETPRELLPIPDVLQFVEEVVTLLLRRVGEHLGMDIREQMKVFRLQPRQAFVIEIDMDNPLDLQSVVQQLLHSLIGEVRLPRPAHTRHDCRRVPSLRQFPCTRQHVGRNPVDVKLRHHLFQAIFHLRPPQDKPSVSKSFGRRQ